MTPPAVDIVIVSFNTRELLRKCLQSIQDHAAPVDVTSIVVDNASADGSAEMVEQAFPATRLIRSSENLGFAAGNNLGIAAGTAPLVLCMNSDAELTPGALGALVKCLEEPSTVVAGPRLLNTDGSFQPSCRRFPNWTRNFAQYSGLCGRFPHLRSLHTWLNKAEHDTATRVDMVSGACFLVRRNYLQHVGGFDENLFFYEEELDLMLPARRQGKHVRYCREAKIIHHGGASVAGSSMSAFAQRQLFRSKYYVFRKHYGRAYARATYLTDRILFGLSNLLSRFRGRPGQGQELRQAAMRAWRESKIPAQTLRHTSQFFDA